MKKKCYNTSVNEFLILKLNNKAVFMKYLKYKNFQRVYHVFKKYTLPLRLIIKMKLDWIFFSNWKKELKKYKQFIIFDAVFSESITKYIKSKNKDSKIIYYYWNVIGNDNNMPLFDKNIDEIWTFDKDDSIKYNLKWNPQFYTNKIELKDGNIRSDLVFLGRNKGREEEINKVDKLFKNYNLETNLIIINKETDLISYDDYLKYVSESKAILDILAKGQNGLTLRCMESLFLEKKLITNNSDIKNYNFYNKNNIFILGEDDPDKLVSFLNSDYVKIENKIRYYYDYEEWLRRMMDERFN